MGYECMMLFAGKIASVQLQVDPILLNGHGRKQRSDHL